MRDRYSRYGGEIGDVFFVFFRELGRVVWYCMRLVSNSVYKIMKYYTYHKY